jgi:DNA-binding Xre family transcriptional regulator
MTTPEQVLAIAASQWTDIPTPQQIIKALEAGGFWVVALRSGHEKLNGAGKTIAERIEDRLRALGKNASSVALEAGLGRSSVRDILVGKVTSPRLDTLEKLAEPLKCDLDYLTGSGK